MGLINRTLTPGEIEHLASLPGVQYEVAKRWLTKIKVGDDTGDMYHSLTSAYGLSDMNGDTFSALATGMERAERKYLLSQMI